MALQMIEVPKWIIVLRGFQFLLAVIVLGISGYGVYWIRFNSWGFAIFTSLITILFVLYDVLSSNVAACKGLYNQYVLLAGNAVGVVFWLSAMGSLAATRAAFVVPTTINECVYDGSGGVCSRKRSGIGKREYVATYAYLNMMSAAAGLSAIVMLLFVAILVTFALSFNRRRTEAARESASAPGRQELNELKPIQSQYQPVQQQYYQQYSQDPETVQQYPQQNATPVYNQAPHQQYR